MPRMNTTLMIGSILLAISGGCAVDAGGEPEVSTTESEIVVQCGPVNFLEQFFAEPELIHLIGTRSCKCFGFVQVTGSLDGYGYLDHKFTCDNR